jgi:hypothetical protein
LIERSSTSGDAGTGSAKASTNIADSTANKTNPADGHPPGPGTPPLEPATNALAKELPHAWRITAQSYFDGVFATFPEVVEMWEEFEIHLNVIEFKRNVYTRVIVE